VGGNCPRTTQTRSNGGSWLCVVRNASRRSRFHRLRTTAFPTRRETVKPIRECPLSLVAPYNTTQASEAELRASNTRLNSLARNNRACFGNGKSLIVTAAK
jgi:hypothetical protein